MSECLRSVERLRNGGQPDLADLVEAEINSAYADGRRDEIDATNLAWANRLVPLLKELEESEYLSEQQCAALCGTDILWWRFFRDAGQSPANLPQNPAATEVG